MGANEINMERNLQDLLKGVVVTPFDEEITNRLTEVCNIFAKELTITGKK